MARPKTRNDADIYRERDKKYYEYKSIKARKEWGFVSGLQQAAQVAGESVNEFLIRAAVERARSFGVPFENGPFYDGESADNQESTDSE